MPWDEFALDAYFDRGVNRNWGLSSHNSLASRVRQSASLNGVDPEVAVDEFEQGRKWCTGHQRFELFEVFGVRNGKYKRQLSSQCRDFLLNKTNGQKGRCSGTTRAGLRCQKGATQGTYCLMHVKGDK